MKGKEMMALAASMLLLGSAPTHGQLLCELFECEDGASGDTSDGSSTNTGEDTSGEDTVDESPDDVEDLVLPDSASDQGVASSAYGIATANEARENGRDHGQSHGGTRGTTNRSHRK